MPPQTNLLLEKVGSVVQNYADEGMTIIIAYKQEDGNWTVVAK